MTPTTRSRRVSALTSLALAIAAASAYGPARADDAAAGDELFEKQVRPILVERCGECHGSKAKVKGGLRLLSRESLLKGGDSGPAAEPGKPDDSLIVQAVRYVDEPRMPPAGKLTDAEIAALTRWVAIGMPWPGAGKAVVTAKGDAFRVTDEHRQFWSFRPVKDAPPPPVRDPAWPRTDIDRFILAALEAKGLKPAPEADRRAFIRRATYDLTGLPPTPEAVDAFVEDSDPGAYATLIDRLLASPEYGERWGRHWLDLVRYTDSFDARIAGSNNEMDINDSWRYRDWVVNALNRDLPYDRFVTEQLAGDVLAADPNGTYDPESVVATGVLALGNWGGGDADKEKLLTDIADDQVDLVGRAFLGLTVACARCHDHKFDPIPTKDYYGLAGIFFSTHILPNVGPKTNGPPMLRIPLASASELARREARAKRLKELDGEIAAALAREKSEIARARLPETAQYVVAAWESARTPGTPQALRPYAVRRWSEALGLKTQFKAFETPLRDVLGKAGVMGWRGREDTPSALINTKADDATVLSFRVPARSLVVHPGPTSAVVLTWTSPVSGVVGLNGGLNDTDPGAGDGVAWSLSLERPGAVTTLGGGEIPNGGAAEFRTPGPASALDHVSVEPGDTVRLTVSPRGSHTCDSTHVRLTLTDQNGHQRWDVGDDLSQDPLAGNPHADRLGHPKVWALGESGVASMKVAAGQEAVWDALKSAVRGASADAASVRAAADRFAASFRATDESSPFWVGSADENAEFSEAAKAYLALLRGERDRLNAGMTRALDFANGAQEGGVPGSPHAGVHDVRVHVRGSYARLGDPVPRHFPVVLAGESQRPVTNGSGRLDLARWLTSADHPLTPRVMANRVWQHHLGGGIVRTPSNFGKLGEPPTHPELLDHLAASLVKNGWSLKRLHREIMLSATYRQSTEADPETFRADPDNRLFGRANRRRLDAESLRDSLLAVSGRLDPTRGGPSVRDPASRRRSLYQMTIRSDRASFGALFDAADPTAIVDTRTVSTVAPQALYLLNNPFVLDLAASLAARLADDRGADESARLDRAYALLFGRGPSDEERRVGRECLASFRAEQGAGPDADRKAWAAYCHVLLCTNEWIHTD